MAAPRTHIDLDDLRRRYVAGKSEQLLSFRYGAHRKTIHRYLKKMGIPLRGIAEANLIRMRNLSAAERQELTAAAHEAVRGKRQSPEHQAKIARTREIKQLGVSPIEIKLIRILRARGLSCTPQKAVGRYNVDVAINCRPSPWRYSEAAGTLRVEQPRVFDSAPTICSIADGRPCLFGFCETIRSSAEPSTMWSPWQRSFAATKPRRVRSM